MRKATLAQAAKLLGKLNSGEIDRPTAQALIEGKFRIETDESVSVPSDPAPPAEFIGNYRDNAAVDQAVKDDPRIAQAKILWDKGFGRELKMSSFEEYLASIPVVPSRPSIEYFDRLVLVERRVTLVAACRLSSLKFGGNDNIFVPFDLNETRPDSVYWMWSHDGRRNRNRRPSDCRDAFQTGEIGCDAHEGVAIYAQDHAVINGHNMDLPGSVYVERSDVCARVGHWSGELQLYWFWGDRAIPFCGSASRGK